MTGRRHPGGRTDAQTREAIRDSAESTAALARRYGINPKTVAKWRKRDDAADLPTGPKPTGSRCLTAEQEEVIVRFRKHTLLPLDDCLYALQAHIPNLSRSTLHRCFQRHGISRLPETVTTDDEAIAAQARPIGHMFIDKATVQVGETQSHLFSAVDQASRFAFVQMARQESAAESVAFLDTLLETLPFRIERISTPDAAPFTLPDPAGTFTRRCAQLGVEHHVIGATYPAQPGHMAGVDRLLRDSVTFASEADVTSLLRNFVHAYNFRRRLKALRGRTPFDFIRQAWLSEPHRFLREPCHEILGPEAMQGHRRDGI